MKKHTKYTLILFSIIYTCAIFSLKFNLLTFEEIIIAFLTYIFIDTTSLVSKIILDKEKDD
jgi:hypothetical protein